MPNTNIIQTNQLTKIIDGRELVKDISLHVKRERSTGFWGQMARGRRR